MRSFNTKHCSSDLFHHVSSTQHRDDCIIPAVFLDVAVAVLYNAFAVTQTNMNTHLEFRNKGFEWKEEIILSIATTTWWSECNTII